MTGGAIDAHFSEVIEKKGGSFNPVSHIFGVGEKRLRIELFAMPSCSKIHQNHQKCRILGF